MGFPRLFFFRQMFSMVNNPLSSHSSMPFTQLMGGFACIVSDGDGKVTPAKFTARGIRFLSEREPNFIIPQLQVPLTSITDRSKSSSLGKALLIIQVAWFCLNCLSRLIENLPLSLLEVSTLAHGLYTLASFAAWSYKPQNVDEPTWIPISGDDQTHKHAREALALMQLAYDSDHGRAEEWNQLLRAVRAHQCGPEFWITQPVDSKLGLALQAADPLWAFHRRPSA